MVLEKTLESPLNWKEIKPVDAKGNQSWIFIGRTQAEAIILWPPDAKSQLIRKDSEAGKDWRQEEMGTTGDKMVGWHHWLNAHEFEQALGDGESWHAAVLGVAKSWTQLNYWKTAIWSQWKCPCLDMSRKATWRLKWKGMPSHNDWTCTQSPLHGSHLGKKLHMHHGEGPRQVWKKKQDNWPKVL